MVHGEVKRGAKIIFYLKAEQFVFSEERRLKNLVKILLEFIGFPLELHVEKSKEKEVTDSGKMKTTIEEKGKEGDEPKIEEFDEEKENEETKKNMKKGKEVFHEWEHLIMIKLLRGCHCRQWRFLRFSSSPETEDILSGNRDRCTQCKLCCRGP